MNGSSLTELRNHLCRVVVITGPCGAGKTVLARILSDRLAWPLLEKDVVKEMLYDHLGVGDLTWSQKLGAVSYDINWAASGQMARARVSHIVEYPATAASFLDKAVQKLRSRWSAHVIVLELTAEAKILRARFQERIDNGSRHPGHRDGDLAVERADFSKAPPFGHNVAADRYHLIRSDHFEAIDVNEVVAICRGSCG